MCVLDNSRHLVHDIVGYWLVIFTLDQLQVCVQGNRYASRCVTVCIGLLAVNTLMSCLYFFVVCAILPRQRSPDQRRASIYSQRLQTFTLLNGRFIRSWPLLC